MQQYSESARKRVIHRAARAPAAALIAIERIQLLIAAPEPGQRFADGLASAFAGTKR